MTSILHAFQRIACAAFIVAVGACGGGDNGAQAGSAQVPELSTTAPRVTGLAQTIDAGTGGRAVEMRVALSANGDGFAAWIVQSTIDEPWRLWASRYRASTVSWEPARRVDLASEQASIVNLDLAVDDNGRAVVVWAQVTSYYDSGRDVYVSDRRVLAARFDAGARTWAAPVQLSDFASHPQIAKGVDGTMLAFYEAEAIRIRGRFLDPATGDWQPEVEIEQNPGFRGNSGPAVARFDGAGNVLVAFANTLYNDKLIASNAFIPSRGGWQQAAPGQMELLGVVPGSDRYDGWRIDLAAVGAGDFLGSGGWPLGKQVRPTPWGSRASRAARGHGAPPRPWCPPARASPFGSNALAALTAAGRLCCGPSRAVPAAPRLRPCASTAAALPATRRR